MTEGHELLSVIPARGGSKGLPRKNARQLGHAPLFAWSYFSWRDARLPGPCWLSTEDDELARMGCAAGIEVLRRPADLATDEASAVDVALHAVDEYKKRFGADPQWYLLLQPTSPFRPPAALAVAWRRASLTRPNAILGVKPLYRSLSSLYYAKDNGELTPLDNTRVHARRQDVRPLFTPNGALYLVQTEVLRRDRTLFPEHTLSIPMNALQSIDIDDTFDWVLAEAIVTSGADWSTFSD